MSPPWVISSLSLRGGRLRGLSLDIQAGWLVRSKLAVPSLRRLSGSFLLKRRCAAHCRPLYFCQIVKMCLRWTLFRLDKLPDLACWEGESVLPAIWYLRSSDKEPKSTFLVSYEREKFVAVTFGRSKFWPSFLHRLSFEGSRCAV